MAAQRTQRYPRLLITIDGPAGSGKSTVAQRLADRLGLDYLDTGAMYRAAALLALERGIDAEDGPTLAGALRQAELRFDWHASPPPIMIGDRDISRRIRDMDVSAIVSPVSARGEVRAVLVEQQRRIAREHPHLVTEGRDQGSAVFPDASVRFYLDAEPGVRAERRRKQLAETGRPVGAAQVMNDIARRDRIDSTRADAPLTRPIGAIVVDTTNLSLDEVVDRLEASVREHLAVSRSEP